MNLQTPFHPVAQKSFPVAFDFCHRGRHFCSSPPSPSTAEPTAVVLHCSGCFHSRRNPPLSLLPHRFAGMASASSLIISSTIPLSSSLKCVSLPIVIHQNNSYSKRFILHKNSSGNSINPSRPTRKNPKTLLVRAAEYKFPDPIPEFAEAETEKFRDHLIEKLSKKDVFEDSVDEVVGICTEIFAKFMNEEYGGPGTLLVDPFWKMADTINESELPGGPQAARAAVKWAQDHVDKDWKEWNGN